MAVKNIRATSLPILTDTSHIKESKHVSRKRYKLYYCICLNALVHTIHTQIENKCMRNDYLYLIGSRFTKDLYKWVHRFKYKGLFLNDFLKSLITSVALFAMGVKLTNELVAWRIF